MNGSQSSVTGKDLYTQILEELETLPASEKALRLMHTLGHLLSPSRNEKKRSNEEMKSSLELIDHVLFYLDVSTIPGVIARVLGEYLDSEELVLTGVEITSTIAQSKIIEDTIEGVEGDVNILVKGDTIEVLFKILNKYSLNYMIVGHSVYTLYLISQQRRNK